MLEVVNAIVKFTHTHTRMTTKPKRRTSCFVVLLIAASVCARETTLQRLARTCGVLPALDAAAASCAAVACTSGDCSAANARCHWGLYCRNGTCSKDPTPTGEPCLRDGECAGSFGGAYCAASGVCMQPPFLGEACSAACPAPMTCEAGRCTSDYTLELGQHCNATAAAGQPHCRLALMCDAATATCVRLPTLGAACTAEAGCSVPYQCSATGVCTGLLSAAEGELCATSLHCAPGLVCSRNSVCAQPHNNTTDSGSIGCEGDGDCAADSYCACDAATGTRRCFGLPVSSTETADAFEELAACAALDEDNSVAACADKVLAVLRADNSSAMLGSTCAREGSPSPPTTTINSALLIVPVAVLGLVLLLAIAVRFGASAPKSSTHHP